jgi:CDGSH-type Zn-finger protein
LAAARHLDSKKTNNLTLGTFIIKNKKIMKKGKVVEKVPTMVDLENGKTYAWCSCGLSGNQPWCNGAHKGSEFAPEVFKADKDRKAAICLCKQTSNPPYCDGSHKDC